jgi:DsbC/DsbD-like thiol-disulfide interchange protein
MQTRHVPQRSGPLTRSWGSLPVSTGQYGVMIEKTKRILALGGVFFGAMLLALQPAVAEPASAWSASSHSSIRLLDGGAAAQAPWRMAGLELKLAAGFKTYWRMPGDSGVPPLFDWSRSRNVAEVEVLWPAPHRFDDMAGSSIGYSSHLIFPLKVRLHDPAKPAQLVLGLDYAVCERLCVPATGEAKLDLPPGQASTREAGRIDAFLAKVPHASRVETGVAPAISAVIGEPDGRSLAVDATVAGNGVAVLFVEGPDGWIFGAPMPLASRPAGPQALAIRYRVPVEARPDGASLHGLDLTLTLVSGDQAIEARTRLDAGQNKR